MTPDPDQVREVHPLKSTPATINRSKCQQRGQERFAILIIKADRSTPALDNGVTDSNNLPVLRSGANVDGPTLVMATGGTAEKDHGDSWNSCKMVGRLKKSLK